MVEIGILYDRIRSEEKSLINSAKKKGVNIKLIDCRKTVFDVSSLEKLDLDVALQRCISLMRAYHSAVILENRGLEVVNSSRAIWECGNKLLTSLILARKGIRTPETKVAFSVDSALSALEELGYPSILKPIIGSWGRLVTILSDPQSAKSILESWDQLGGSLYKIYYLQKYIKTGSIRDIRCLVIGRDVVAAIYRYSPPGEWRSNLAIGGRGEKCEITDEMRDTCSKIAEAIGSGIFGVDLMEDDDGLIVHEVNHNPEFMRTALLTGVDIPSLVMDYMIHIAKK